MELVDKERRHELIEGAIREWALSLSPASIAKDSGTGTTLQSANALREIRDSGLYKHVNDDFYIYCARRFGFRELMVDYYLNYNEAGYSGSASSSTHHKKTAKESHVYFIEAADKIKIGVTRNLKMRISALGTGSPVPLKVLGTIKGDVSKEKELHELFESSRSHGEWFFKNDNIIEYIKEACHE